MASRGSIAMKTAMLKATPGNGGMRFEVHSMPTRGNHGVQRWYIKANHPVEASRWVQALQKSIEWARREAERPSVDSEVSSLLTPSTTTTRATSGTFVRRSQTGLESVPSSIGDDGEESTKAPPKGDSSMDEHEPDVKGHETEGSSSMAESENHPPHNTAFDLHANTTVTQMELTADLLAHLPTSSSKQATEFKNALVDSFSTAKSMLTDYVQMVREREEWWKDKLERERERQNVWEESLQAVVKEGEIMARELRDKSRRRSRTITKDASLYLTASEFGTIRKKLPSLGLEDLENKIVESPEPTPRPTETIVAPLATAVPVVSTPTPPATSSPTRQVSLVRRLSSMASPPPRPLSLIKPATSPHDEDEEVDTDEEDEFFDAIESNTLPNLVITDSLKGCAKIELPALIDQSQYEGYTHLRKRLAITTDDRPPMSLWAVLKNSIGKDLTKISFPVFFNEPTSMLQRMVSTWLP